MQPIRECIMDIKSIERAIEPLTSAKLLFSNGLMELVNLFIAGLLFVFASKTNVVETLLRASLSFSSFDGVYLLSFYP